MKQYMKKFLLLFFMFLFLFQTKNFSNDCGVKQILEQVLSKQDVMGYDLSVAEELQEIDVEILASSLDAVNTAVDNLDEAFETLEELLTLLDEVYPVVFIGNILPPMSSCEKVAKPLFKHKLAYSLDMPTFNKKPSVFKAGPIDSIVLLESTERSQFSSIDTVYNSHVITDKMFTLLDTTTQLAADLGLSLEECQAELEDLFSCIDLWSSVVDDVCITPTFIECPFP
ncbi:hypothetical protein ACFLYA_01655 [Candidatus Dependentiae bacterium]